jgi:hypothetical protein
MNRFISILLAAMLLTANVTPAAMGITDSDGNTITAPNGANYLADAVATKDADGSLIRIEETSDAQDTGTGDIRLKNDYNDALIIGSTEQFDGLALDVYSGSVNGSFVIEYFDGSDWEALTDEISSDFVNDADGSMQIQWHRTEDWQTRQITYDLDESGVSSTSPDLYFVRLKVLDTYDDYSYFSQIGLINYNLHLTFEDELENSIDNALIYSANNSTGASATVHNYRKDGDDYFFALDAERSSLFYLDLQIEGYVGAERYPVTVSQSQLDESFTLAYAQRLVALDYFGETLEIAVAYAGENETECEIDNGSAYCAVPYDEDEDKGAVVNVVGYVTNDSEAIEDRATYSAPQGLTPVVMDYAYMAVVEDEDGNRVSGAAVTIAGDRSCTSLGNGEYGCVLPTAITDTSVTITASGYEDFSSSFSTTRTLNTDAQVEETFTLTSTETDDDDEITDTDGDGIADEDDNCPETYNSTQTDSDGDGIGNACDDTDDSDNDDDDDNDDDNNDDADLPDLEVDNIYTDDGDIMFKVSNDGDEDVDSNIEVVIELYVDGDLEWDTEAQRKSSSSWLNDGKSTTYNAGDLDLDRGTYDIEVCVDTEDDVVEEDEDNNCREEEIYVSGRMADDPDDDISCSDPFYDTNHHWAEKAICLLYRADVVDGRSHHYYEPYDEVTRAEFLKMVLLNADYNPYGIESGDIYSDVDTGDWFYEYVTYATRRGFVNGGYTGEFRPNDPINRAEALVMIMRIAGQEDWRYDNRDIPFWDVDEDDWYAYAVVIAHDDGIIEGYNGHTFGASRDLDRAEAAVIMRRVWYAYYN